MDNGDILFGLCDLGVGEHEMSYLSMSELLDVSRMLPSGLEQDLSFWGDRPLNEYVLEARAADRITA